ncbi:uncharacterized protein NEMAJ01_0972 [Nematocida major]|uniref:uncharacterized protein n=1 Tax=Nematocida major TaxID=1912982 RepID=UPI002008592F|nr:uncharacterized protein NEMAJ01_0972 [Nematocida major]KAH9386076.1 hypothetical protein NEMAJ01_0972 [Nematocida major]
MCMNAMETGVSSGDTKDLRLPKDIKPYAYDLDIILKESMCEFAGKLRVNAVVLKSTNMISFHSKKLEILSINAIQVGPKDATEEVEIVSVLQNNSEENVNSIVTVKTKDVLKENNEVIIDILYHGVVSEDMAGFYRSEDRVDDAVKYIYSTQFEATSARLAFPCWDEPEFKAMFNISITAPSRLTVLSNAALKEEIKEIDTSADDAYDAGVEYTKHVFKTTPIMSTYLVAWVIGELEYIKEDRIRVYTPVGQKETGRLALDVAVRCLKFFDEYFGIVYQMEKLDMVAIPNFSAGAMENWGLVTYRSSSLLYREGSTTEMNKLYIAETVCHELAHQWFGNLVTMRWWNDLWLNEGFATWAGTLATATMAKEINLLYNPWEIFLENDITHGMQMDGKLSTHPINVKVESAGEISSIFDAISYSKGASMIHMLSKYVHESYFMEGLRKYIKKHKYQNTETCDLWAELDKGDNAIVESMSNWINTPGFPKVLVDVEDGQLALSQTRYLPAEDLKKTSSERTEQWMIFLTKKRFTEADVEEESILFPEKTKKLRVGDELVMFNADSAGFYLVEYSEKALERHIVPLLKSDKLTQFDRFGIFRDIIRLSKDGHRDATYALNVLQHIKDEEKAFIVGQAVEYLKMIQTRYKGDESIKLAVSTELSNLLQKYVDGVTSFETVPDDVEERKMRIIAVSALAQIRDSPVQKEVMRLAETEELFKVHKDYKMSMYCSYAKFGGKAAYEHMYNIVKSKAADENEKLRAILALSCCEDMIEEAFKLFAEKNQYIKNQDKFRMVQGIAMHKDQAKTLKLFLSHFNDITKLFETTLDNVARFVEVFISSQVTKENIALCKEFFEKKENIKDAWVSAIKKGLDNANISNRFYESNMTILKEWAGKNTE